MENQNINKPEENQEPTANEPVQQDAPVVAPLAPTNEQSGQKESPAEVDGDNSSNDVDDNKAMAIVGYIFPILFFIPLVTDAKNSTFAKFHANQQVVLLIFAIAVNVIGSLLPIIGWFLILPIGSVMILVFVIMGIINAAKGKTKALPMIGGIEIIK